MNELNSLENQLRQWKLRQPSEAIRENLFGERIVGGETVFGLRWSEAIRWLVPVMGCFFLVVGSLSPKHTQIVQNVHSFSQFHDSIQTPALLNDPNTEQNAVPHTTFALAFGARSASSMASFNDFKTNTLRH